jgi:signal transduction histidine kinase/ActR/RegA family two-component response regulator
MRWFSNLSIRWKLVLIAVLTCVTAELLLGIAVTTYSSSRYESQKRQDVSMQTGVLAASLAAPLAFGDASAAREYLDALQADGEVAAAGAYSAKGALLASYVRDNSRRSLLPRALPPIGQHVAGTQLTVCLPVTRAGNDFGRVFLVVDIDSLAKRLWRFGGLMLVAGFASLLIAVPLSMWLSAAISKPIREIAAAASRVTDGDLSVKLPEAQHGDELGVLVATFGKMMASLRDLMQQERLRALGQISSGVAHDINNALSPMALMTQSLLEREPDLSPQVRNYLHTANRVVNDVSATVARMRDFSRKRETEATLAPLDLNLLVQQSIELTSARWSDIQQSMGSVIELKAEFDAALPAIMGVEGEIRDALTNLIFNAVDAMPEGGTLSLRTRAVPAAMPTHVEVEIADTGHGMDEETKRRCFEPFFTTKGTRGTGLGMAMVYGMVQRHSAEIGVDSTIGKGTSVRLTFLARTAVAQSDGTAKPGSAIAVAPARILLVDDDPFVLESLALVLRLDGHEILTAEGGQAGIDHISAALREARSIDVVITDLGMPHVDGKQVASAVKTLLPRTPVILLTGWGERLNASGQVPEGVDLLLGKPPKLDELRAGLASLIPSQPAAARSRAQDAAA